jgi:hypothetical protein
VADEVAKKHPNVTVGTLAYRYSRKPPKTIKPRPNVMVQLCSIECCMMHAIDDPTCPGNVSFCDDLREWGRICDKIGIWNYNTVFIDYLLPCPNLHVIGDNVRYFVANQAKGVFMQAVFTPAGEMSDLRNYILSRILWDPTLDDIALRDEFIRLHYGRAGGPIREFLDLTQENVLVKDLHRYCFGNALNYGIDETIAAKGMAFFADAMRCAENETVRSRVEKASMCAYRAAIDSVWERAWMVPILPIEETDETLRLKALVDHFFRLCRKYGATELREGEPISIMKGRIEAALGSKIEDEADIDGQGSSGI